MVARRTNSDPLDLDANELFNVLDVTPRLVGQIVVVLRAGGWLFPARQRLIVHLDLRQQFGIRRKALEFLAVDEVLCGDLELVKVVEDVELGEVDGGVVVAGVRVLDNDQIEPAAAALTAGGYTDFMADLLELFAEGIELLGREGAAGGMSDVCFGKAQVRLTIRHGWCRPLPHQ